MIRSENQIQMTFDSSLKLGLEAYKDCWRNILGCLRRGDEYISREDLNLLFSAAEACESSLFYLIYDPGKFYQSVHFTFLTCFNAAKFCQGYRDELDMGKCARSLKLYAQSCLTYMKPQEA